jgi:hypothetical protein
MVSRILDEEAIFPFAGGIPSFETRSKYLDQICAGDINLQQRIGLPQQHPAWFRPLSGSSSSALIDRQ